MTEFEQLALDPLVAPRRVLGREPLDEGHDLRADRWPTHPLWMGPCPYDQTAVPPQDGAGRDQPVRSQRSGQESDQCGEHRPVRPVPPGLGLGTAQHRDLMPQHQQLDIL